MISTIFQYGAEVIEVRIVDNSCLFRTQSTQGGFVPIEGIKLDKAGSIKEHPDLKGDKKWKEKTVNRFKKNLKEKNTEKQRMKYIMEDLIKHGYKPLYYQQKGFRPVKIK